MQVRRRAGLIPWQMAASISPCVLSADQVCLAPRRNRLFTDPQLGRPSTLHGGSPPGPASWEVCWRAASHDREGPARSSAPGMCHPLGEQPLQRVKSNRLRQVFIEPHRQGTASVLVLDRNNSAPPSKASSSPGRSQKKSMGSCASVRYDERNRTNEKAHMTRLRMAGRFSQGSRDSCDPHFRTRLRLA